MGKFLHSMGNAFLTILMILLVVYGWAFIEMKLLLKSQPELFGFVFYQQQEADMTPEFEPSDIVVVKKNADFKEGDIILYFDSKDSKYKAHYVVSSNTLETVTKCATCNSNNEAISNNNIVGKAVGKVLFMGTIVQFFKNKAVLITIGVVGVVLLVISQYMEFKPKKNEETQEKNIAKE